MCFSAEASFAAAALLVSAGVWSIRHARKTAPPWTALACFPLAFGVQQAIEGLVWLSADSPDSALTLTAGRGFLFFSHFFWPTFAPYAVMRAEPDPARRRWIRYLVLFVLIFALSIAAPALLLPNWLEVGVRMGSIDYRTRLIYDGVVHRDVLKAIYAAIVVGAFFLASDIGIRLYGVAILVSVIAAAIWYGPIFISVWCFFAAILSLCVVLLLARGPRAIVPGDAS